MLSVETLTKLAPKTLSHGPAIPLIDLVNAIETQNKIRWIRQEQNKAKVEFDKVNAEFEKEIGLVRSQCEHKATTYYPDAAGGSDSETICDICGMSLEKRK